MAGPAFAELPTEILESIFLLLDAPSLFVLAQSHRLFKQLTTDSPIIWRHLCHTSFTTWAPHHHIAAKFAGPLSDVDWRALYFRRKRIERETRRLLNHIVATQHERMRCINEIANFGNDAKESLLRECACPDDVEDVLARRYYANAALERIHREMAINVWKDLQDAKDVPIDRALGAYDLFARGGDDVDFDLMADDLNRLARGLLSDQPGFQQLSTRSKASALALYLRNQGFQGVPDTSYRALRNSFIGLALQSPTHQSLPLISAALFCALAQRVGLDARPCGFLFHVYCLVYAPRQYTLDGDYNPSSTGPLDFMYLDPFRSSDEVRQGDLLRVLRDMGVPSADHQTFLSDTTTREMVLRTARNIMNSVQTIRQTQVGVHGISAAWLDAYPDMDSAFYSTLWAMLILGPGDDGAQGSAQQVSSRRRQYLPYLLEHFQTHVAWDVALLEQYVIPMFYTQPEGQRLLQFVQSMHQIDMLRRPLIRRTARVRNVEFRVGQLFRHKRYQYEGIITGWDTSCDAGEEWIQNMGVDRLPGGRNQAFYHVLVHDKSVRYVAAENIEPVGRETLPSAAIMKLAGRHFKRWDGASHTFISNLRDEYPDD
ncbi:Hemimethylated DNA-binding protein YccV like-domain-containing protein [Boeremia exigua]|uniref:Hemimethylated DNA-binding protein YccV like-domain-containing protein n=1 Tax=Boeremia exigua TaxID=749465 RepID=UPI001E8D611F|nr:Hemimethylated DNA-binding protein YccV like-domain-containing protein [Boeremia exigua]KAH6637676.1 Hemimethylated DNA-binding protein YccV like-domain-containing protein [Boeremia exigua]